MIRNIVLSLVALVVVATFTTSASAQYRRYDQGGVIPCSADDYRFVQGRGWVSNCRRGGNVHRSLHGHYGSRSTARPFSSVTVTKRSFVVPTGQIMVYRGTCLRNTRTGEVRC